MFKVNVTFIYNNFFFLYWSLMYKSYCNKRNYFFLNLSNLHLNKKKITNFNNNFFFFDYFLNKYFSNKIKNNSILQLNSKFFFFSDQNKYLFWLLNIMKKNNLSLFFNLNNFKKIIELFLYSLYTKDTKLISNWIKVIMEKIYYKNHKKFLIFFKNVLFFLFKYLNNYLKIKGIKFLLKGKIALGGNSKKKSFDLKFGKFSLTKKSSIINYNKNFIKTISGTLGFYFFIFS